MCTSFIRRFLCRISQGQLFTTRDCLAFGSRAAVDQALSRLVKSGVLIRLARGVYLKGGATETVPSPLEVARVKAQAFGKILVKHGADLAREFGLVTEPAQAPTFLVNGRSSSFGFGELVINLKGTCMKKIYLGDCIAGEVVRALWHVGKKGCNSAAIAMVTRRCGRVERQLFRQSARWMPGWMSSQFRNLRLPLVSS